METPYMDRHNNAVLNIIRRRFSCRNYRPEEVDHQRLSIMAEALRWAPSACNRQPYRFLFVSDTTIISEISAAVPLGPASVNRWMLSAPLIVAAVGKPEFLWHRMTQVVDTDYHRTDAIIAMDHLSLVATEIGLGTCWVGWFHRKKVGRLLGIGKGEEVVILMTVGFPEREPHVRKGRKNVEDLVTSI